MPRLSSRRGARRDQTAKNRTFPLSQNGLQDRAALSRWASECGPTPASPENSSATQIPRPRPAPEQSPCPHALRGTPMQLEAEHLRVSPRGGCCFSSFISGARRWVSFPSLPGGRSGPHIAWERREEGRVTHRGPVLQAHRYQPGRVGAWRFTTPSRSRWAAGTTAGAGRQGTRGVSEATPREIWTGLCWCPLPRTVRSREEAAGLGAQASPPL